MKMANPVARPMIHVKKEKVTAVSLAAESILMKCVRVTLFVAVIIALSMASTFFPVTAAVKSLMRMILISEKFREFRDQ